MTLVWRPGNNAITDPDALIYIDKVEKADGQNLEYDVAKAINDFVVDCKNDGNWDAIKASCILAGARTLDGALVSLAGIAPTKQGTEGGWDYNRKTGLKGNGTDNYLDSNSAANVVTPQNNAHISVYATESSPSIVFAGAISAASVITQIATDGGGRSGVFMNSSADANRQAFSVPMFLAGSRSQAASYNIRVNNSTFVANVASAPPGGFNHYVLARNTLGTPSIANGIRLAFYSFGESLDLAALDTRVSALITAIGAAIP